MSHSIVGLVIGVSLICTNGIAIGTTLQPEVAAITPISAKFINESSIQDEGRPWPAQSFPKFVLEITFQTETDLQKRSIDGGFFPTAIASACDEDGNFQREKKFELLPGLFDSSALLAPGRPSVYGLSKKNNKKDLTYHFYVIPRYHPKIVSSVDYTYDLTTQPQSICFAVIGGGCLGLRSHVAKVPKPTVEQAVLRTQPRCDESYQYCKIFSGR